MAQNYQFLLHSRTTLRSHLMLNNSRHCNYTRRGKGPLIVSTQHRGGVLNRLVFAGRVATCRNQSLPLYQTLATLEIIKFPTSEIPTPIIYLLWTSDIQFAKTQITAKRQSGVTGTQRHDLLMRNREVWNTGSLFM